MDGLTFPLGWKHERDWCQPYPVECPACTEDLPTKPASRKRGERCPQCGLVLTDGWREVKAAWQTPGKPSSAGSSKGTGVV